MKPLSVACIDVPRVCKQGLMLMEANDLLAPVVKCVPPCTTRRRLTSRRGAIDAGCFLLHDSHD